MHPFTQQLLESRGFRKQVDGSWTKGDGVVVAPTSRATGAGVSLGGSLAPVAEMKKRGRSPLAAKFEELWKGLNGPELKPEFRFHKTRKWRFDYCHERTRVAIELDGGIFAKGRHTTAKGFQGDCEKLNAATEDGYFVFRLATGMISADRLEVIIRTIRRLSYP